MGRSEARAAGWLGGSRTYSGIGPMSFNKTLHFLYKENHIGKILGRMIDFICVYTLNKYQK